MNWVDIGNLIFSTLVPLALTVGAFALIIWVGIKKKEIQDKTKSDLVDKYLDMAERTIATAVLTTTQTYVEALKNKNAFDEEAQKVAFKMTYDAVKKMLTEEALSYIAIAVGDVETFLQNKIEAQVKLQKQ